MKITLLVMLLGQLVLAQSYRCRANGNAAIISTDPSRGPSQIALDIVPGAVIGECTLDDTRLECGVKDLASGKWISSGEIGSRDHMLSLRTLISTGNQSSFFGFGCRDSFESLAEDRLYQCRLKIPGRESRKFILSSDVGVAQRTPLEGGNQFECGSTTYGLECFLDSNKIVTGGKMVYTRGITVPYGTRRFAFRQSYGDGFANLSCRESGLLPNVPAEEPMASMWKPTPAPKLLAISYVPRAAAFTGKEYVVVTDPYGGETYDPATKTWRAFTFDNSLSNLIATTKTLWDGREMILCSNSGSLFAYNPELGKSRYIPQVGYSVGGRTCALVDGKVFLWGGLKSGSTITPAVLYDPKTNQNRPISTQGEPPVVSYAFSEAVGSDVIVWGGRNSKGEFVNEGAVYHSSSDGWTPISPVGAPCPRWSMSGSFHYEYGNPFDTTVVSTGAEMLVWGGLNASCGLMNEGALFNPQTDSWRPMSTRGAPPRGRGYATAFANGKLFVWGGRTRRPSWMASAWSYDPARDRWTPVSVPNHFTRTGSLLLAGANEMLLVGGTTLANEWPEIGYVINGFQ